MNLALTRRRVEDTGRRGREPAHVGRGRVSVAAAVRASAGRVRRRRTAAVPSPGTHAAALGPGVLVGCFQD